MNDLEKNKALYEYAQKLLEKGSFTKEQINSMFNINLDVVNNIYYPTKDEGFFSYQNGKPKAEVYELARYFINEIGYFNYDGYDYLYDENYYKYVSKDYIKKMIIDLTLEKCYHHNLQAFYDILKIQGQKNTVELNQWRENSKYKINLKNGIYNLETDELWPHKKEIFFNYILPYDYVENAECPKFDASLTRGFNGNDAFKSAFYEIIGYILLGDEPFLQQSFVLVGDPNSGKSTVLNIIREIVGHENSASVRLSELDDKFMPHRLNNKLVNIVDELPRSGIDSEMFKTLISGGTIQAQDKNKPIYDMKCNARFVISSNGLLKFNETENIGALSRRQYYLPFSAPIKSEDVNHNIISDLKSELSGIFNQAVLGLKRLRQRKKLPVIKESMDIIHKFELEQDSVKLWKIENLVFDESVKDWQKLKTFYKNYDVHCREYGRKPLGYYKFCQSLRNIIINESNDAIRNSYYGYEVKFYRFSALSDIAMR